MTLVKNRFSEQYKEAFRSKIIEMITMQLNRADANVKNIVAVMLLVISYPSVRLIGANYLDSKRRMKSLSVLTLIQIG